MLRNRFEKGEDNPPNVMSVMQSALERKKLPGYNFRTTRFISWCRGTKNGGREGERGGRSWTVVAVWLYGERVYRRHPQTSKGASPKRAPRGAEDRIRSYVLSDENCNQAIMDEAGSKGMPRKDERDVSSYGRSQD